MTDALVETIEELSGDPDHPDWSNITVVTGGQKTRVHGGAAYYIGADYIAKRCAQSLGIEVEEHPCEDPCDIHGRAHMWKTLGRAAGPVRNQAMVFDGADVCLAFPLGESRGTWDCMRRAEEAGIPVINYGDAT